MSVAPTQFPDATDACESAEVALAAREFRTLGSNEARSLEEHLLTCERCRTAAALSELDDDDDAWRWLVRVRVDEGNGGSQLAMVDPEAFSIERELASGGMGKVSLATDRRLGRQVALKEILDPALHERFEREALITAHLQHPAIVPVYEAGRWPDGMAFYTMRRVEGTTLHEAVMAAAGLPERLALLHHVVAVVEAVAYAHGQRVIHRDLKTTNVLVGELGDTVVIDWGLAGYLDEDPAPTSRPAVPRSSPDLTQHGTVMGTPGFMAPEQARGDRTDERTDVFALGAILYTVLAGAPPYLEPGESSEQAVSRVAAGPPRSLSVVAPDAPADLRAICERAMAHRAADRYPTARDMAIELRRFEAGQLLARPYSLRELIARWLRRHRAAVAVGGLAFAALTIVGITAVVSITRSRASERDARQAAESALAEARVAREHAVAGEAAAIEEQARAALLRGERSQALVLLNEALARGRDTPVVRYLLASILRDRDLDRPGTPTHDLVVALAASPTLPPLAIDRDGNVVRGDQALGGLGAEVEAAVISSDHGWLVAHQQDQRVTAWDVTTRTVRWQTTPLAGPGLDAMLQLAPDDSIVAFAAGGDIRILAAATGTTIAATRIEGEVLAIAIHPTASTLAAVTDRGELVVLDGQTLEVRRSWDAPEVRGSGNLAFLGPDQLVYAGGVHASVYELGYPRREIALVHDDSIMQLEVAPAAGLVATTSTRGVRVWRADGALLATRYFSPSVQTIAFSPRGDQLVVTTGDEWNVFQTPALQLVLREQGDRYMATWDAEGTSLAIYNPRYGVVATRAPRGKLVKSFPDALRVQFAGDRILVGDSDDHVTAWTQRGELVGALGDLPTFYDWVASQDGAWLLVADESDASIAVLVETRTGRRIATYPIGGDPDVALTPDGTRGLVLDDQGDARRLRVFDGETGALVAQRTFPEGTSPASVAFLSRTQLLVGWDRTGWQVWDPVTLTGSSVAVGDPEGDAQVVVATNGRFLLVYGYEGKVTVHDSARVGAPIGLIHTKSPKSVRLSDDGTVLAVQDLTGRIELFAVGADEPPRAVVTGATRDAYVLSADGRFLYTGHPDGSAHVWETEQGHELEVMQGHTESIDMVSCAPDGATLLVKSSDGTATLWDVSLDRHTHREIADLAEGSDWTFADGSLRLRPPKK